jgi:ABC-type lipoprotein release transport system permease subunit
MAGKLMASQLFGVSSFELVILTRAVLVLGFCVASVLPARRGAAIDPMKALRTE